MKIFLSSYAQNREKNINTNLVQTVQWAQNSWYENWNTQQKITYSFVIFYFTPQYNKIVAGIEQQSPLHSIIQLSEVSAPIELANSPQIITIQSNVNISVLQRYLANRINHINGLFN